MEQLTLFDNEKYLNKTIELKQAIQKLINEYENEDSNLYCDSEALIKIIKILIIF